MKIKTNKRHLVSINGNPLHRMTKLTETVVSSSCYAHTLIAKILKKLMTIFESLPQNFVWIGH